MSGHRFLPRSSTSDVERVHRTRRADVINPDAGPQCNVNADTAQENSFTLAASAKQSREARMKKPKSETSSRPPSLFAPTAPKQIIRVCCSILYTLSPLFSSLGVSFLLWRSPGSDSIGITAPREYTQCDELALPRALPGDLWMRKRKHTPRRKQAEMKPGLSSWITRLFLMTCAGI